MKIAKRDRKLARRIDERARAVSLASDSRLRKVSRETLYLKILIEEHIINHGRELRAHRILSALLLLIAIIVTGLMSALK